MNHSSVTGPRKEGRRAAATLALLITATAGVVGATCLLRRAEANPPSPPPITGPAPVTAHVVMPRGVEFSGRLSQTKYVQGETSDAYLALTIKTPEMAAQSAAPKTDTVVVVDHSGSMAVENRLPYAKTALRNLIDRLGSDDRIAIVIFDSSAQVLSPLVQATPAEKERLRNVVDTIQPNSGTNMSGGIDLAKSLLRARDGERPQKIILLSDGEANEGITHPRELAKMVHGINEQSGTVSTIGLGLGFNEQLMASLADWGGGSFSYLEHLETLPEVLAKNLNDARQLFAAKSTLSLDVDESITVRDAGGFPMERNGRSVLINTGQLLSGSERRLTLTLAVPTDAVRELSLGTVRFRYANGDEHAESLLPVEATQIAVLEPARRSDAYASIDQTLYRSTWLVNNLGSVKQSLQSDLAAGNYDGAKAKLDAYQNSLAEAERKAGAPLADAKFKDEYQRMAGEIDAAFAGSSPANKTQQNALGKKLLYEGRKSQR